MLSSLLPDTGSLESRRGHLTSVAHVLSVQQKGSVCRMKWAVSEEVTSCVCSRLHLTRKEETSGGGGDGAKPPKPKLQPWPDWLSELHSC